MDETTSPVSTSSSSSSSSSSSPTAPAVSHRSIDGVYDYIVPLTELISSIDSATDGLRHFPVLLRATKSLVLGEAYQTIDAELQAMRENMDDTVSRINTALQSVLMRQKENRAVQTEKRRVTSFATMTDITQEHMVDAGLATAPEPRQADPAQNTAAGAAASGGKTTSKKATR